MSFASPPADPLDDARADLEHALAHLERVREAVAGGKLDAAALPLAEYRHANALKRWQALVRGDDTGGAA